jgi:type I restriction enzyme S subunit
LKAKNYKGNTKVYAVTNSVGFVLSSDLHEFQIHSEDTSNYNVVEKNDFAYNPSRLNIGSIAFYPNEESGLISPMYVVFSIDEEKITPQYLYLNICSNNVKGKIESLKEEGARFRFDFSRWNKIEIPLPPLPIQQRIVEILDKFTSLVSSLDSEIALRQKQYEYYRNKLLTFEEGDEVVEWKKLGDVGNVYMCKRIMKAQTDSEGEVPFFKIGTFGKEPDAYISRELFETYKTNYNYPEVGDVLISAAGTIGRTVVFDGTPSYFQDSNIVWIRNDESLVFNSYLKYFYTVAEWDIDYGGVVARLYNDKLKATPIPIPPKSVQHSIVQTLDTFESLLANLKQERELRQKQYEYYREKLLTFD